ncbi:selenoprotein K isoform X2 [Oncorhynchus mykiss]|nr:selenoprotein K isoform X2 [Oncorhynchus mykiss]ACI67254.1 Selenoprotein K [Salmo salar]ACN09895.1 Selenoprotein K [Salmo salar]ACN12242.1 Selenoprotein K [Salmo salar]
MVYVANGQVLDNRSQSPWRMSFLTDLFWGAVEFIGLFFQSLVQPDLTKRGNSGSSSAGYSDGRGPPGPPGGRRRMGRINHGGGPSAPPMGGGG